MSKRLVGWILTMAILFGILPFSGAMAQDAGIGEVGVDASFNVGGTVGAAAMNALPTCKVSAYLRVWHDNYGKVNVRFDSTETCNGATLAWQFLVNGAERKTGQKIIDAKSFQAFEENFGGFAENDVLQLRFTVDGQSGPGVDYVYLDAWPVWARYYEVDANGDGKVCEGFFKGQNDPWGVFRDGINVYTEHLSTDKWQTPVYELPENLNEVTWVFEAYDDENLTHLRSRITFGPYSNPCYSEPAIKIQKWTNGYDANNPNVDAVAFLRPGDVVTWTYEVRNVGNVPLSNIQVVDDQLAATSKPAPAYVSGDVNSNNVLEVSEVWHYLATGVAEDLFHSTWEETACGGSYKAPTYVNMGKVTGFYGTTSVWSEDPSAYCPFAEPAWRIGRGALILFQNTGNVPLTKGDVKINGCEATFDVLEVGAYDYLYCGTIEVSGYAEWNGVPVEPTLVELPENWEVLEVPVEVLITSPATPVPQEPVVLNQCAYLPTVSR